MAVATPNGVSVFLRYARTASAAIHPRGHNRIIFTTPNVSRQSVYLFDCRWGGGRAACGGSVDPDDPSPANPNPQSILIPTADAGKATSIVNSTGRLASREHNSAAPERDVIQLDVVCR